MIRQRAGGGIARRPIIRKSDQELWEKVSLQKGIDYWHFFKVICSLFIVVCIFHFGYKGRTFAQAIRHLPSLSIYRPPSIETILPREITKITDRTLCIVGLDSQDSDETITIAEEYLSKSCGGLMFVSDQEKHKAHNFRNAKSDFISVENKDLKFWEQRRYITYHALAHAYQHHNNFHWILRIAKPNVLTFVENFARLVEDKGYSENENYYLGHTLTKDGKPFNYALSAYALSRNSLFTIGPTMVALAKGDESSFRCKEEQEYHSEDDFAFICLEKEFHITPGDTRDKDGREFFLLFQVKDHYQEMTTHRDDWFWQNKSPKNTGENCCAKYPVAFTNYKPRPLKSLYSLVYDKPTPLDNMEMKRLVLIQKMNA